MHSAQQYAARHSATNSLSKKKSMTGEVKENVVTRIIEELVTIGAAGNSALKV